MGGHVLANEPLRGKKPKKVAYYEHWAKISKRV